MGEGNGADGPPKLFLPASVGPITNREELARALESVGIPRVLLPEATDACAALEHVVNHFADHDAALRRMRLEKERRAAQKLEAAAEAADAAHERMKEDSRWAWRTRAPGLRDPPPVYLTQAMVDAANPPDHGCNPEPEEEADENPPARWSFIAVQDLMDALGHGTGSASCAVCHATARVGLLGQPRFALCDNHCRPFVLSPHGGRVLHFYRKGERAWMEATITDWVRLQRAEARP